MPTAAIIPAAGSGLRFGEQKQFKLLGKKPLLLHSIEPFIRSNEIQEIVVVVPSEMVKESKRIFSNYFGIGIRVVSGGEHRQISVYNGLKAVSKDCNLVCVHDGARPFVTVKLIESTIHATKKFDGVIAAVKATDTVKQSSNNTVQATLNRDIVWLAQTPQVFDKNMLKKALSSLNEKNDLETDEAMTMEKMGYSIGIVEGSRFNIKITTQEDWVFAEAIINSKPLKTFQ
tara:strand:- start:27510 stop:28199 length:690 start_codon:yes stop_codon:yes gene_type:complete